jgi:colicin import membrane protein
MSSITQHRDASGAPPQLADTFPYGWRDIETVHPDGTSESVRIPLTLEDALHPQLGDVMPETPLHVRIRTYLYQVFCARTRHIAGVLVLSDVLVFWDIPGLKQHSPDIGVVFDVRDPDAERSSFNVAEEGTRPRVIIELVSPSTRRNDIDKKVVQYHQAGVAYYIILDRARDGDPWVLRGYEYAAGGYVEMAKDPRGRLWLKDLGCWLGTNGQQVICYDGVTDAPIGDYLQLASDLQAADERIATEQAQAAEARTQAAEARTQAAEARTQAAEAQARAEAERVAAAAERARADAETEARRASEARNRELEAEIARLRAQPPSP